MQRELQRASQDANDNNAKIKEDHLFTSTEDLVNAGFVMTKEDKSMFFTDHTK